MRWRRGITLVAAALAVLGALSGLTGPAGAATGYGVQPGLGSRPLGHAGRWITDAQGRTIILHGFNMAMKTAPYDPAALGFGAADARLLAAHGFNVVRLNLSLAGLEPQPGQFDDGYLASMVGTVHTLARYGIRTLIVFPEELYNPQFRGEGFPDWMVDSGGIPASVLNHSTFTNFFTNPALLLALDNFWNNAPVYGQGLQDWYAQAWAHVAAAFRGDPAVLGYDVYNEPWPGTAYLSCLPPIGCPGWDAGKLRPFYQKVIGAIHAVDPGHLAFYEPSLMAPFGTPSYLGKAGDGNSGLAFHVYCTDLSGKVQPTAVYGACGLIQQRVMNLSVKQATATGDALAITEFGASPLPAEISHVVGLADQAAVPWMEWTYCKCGDPTEGGTVPGLVYDLTRPRSGANINTANLKVLDEPYPQAVAGTPGPFRFTAATRTFTFRYTPGAGGSTVVYTSPLQYPHGYRIKVAGATVSGAGGPLLTLTARPGARTVTLTLTPR